MVAMRYLTNVVSLELDPKLCNGCGLCLKVCPQAVLARDGAKVRIADRDGCMECGACTRNCEPGAIQVRAGVGCAAALLGNMGGLATGCCSIPTACSRAAPIRQRTTTWPQR